MLVFKENHIYQTLKGLTPVERDIGNYLLILEKGKKKNKLMERSDVITRI